MNKTYEIIKEQQINASLEAFRLPVDADEKCIQNGVDISNSPLSGFVTEEVKITLPLNRTVWIKCGECVRKAEVSKAIFGIYYLTDLRDNESLKQEAFVDPEISVILTLPDNVFPVLYRFGNISFYCTLHNDYFD